MIGAAILDSLGSPSKDRHDLLLEHHVYTTRQSAAGQRFSANELKVSSLASRQATRQLLRVPWDRFHKAYEEYPRWQGLSLWTRRVITSHEQARAELLSTLRKHCPEFVETEVFLHGPNLMGFRLLEWVHNRKFVDAKEKGWLDALVFYGVRHFRSRAVWDYWEHCENGPGRRFSSRFPSFDEWWQRALEVKLCGDISYQEIGPAIQEFIELETMAMWLRPLVTANMRLTNRMLPELESRLRGVLWRSHALSSPESNSNPSNWLSVVRTAKKRWLKEAQGTGRLACFTELLQSHPRPIRLRAYVRHCNESRLRKCLQHYPSFQDWRRAADDYVR